MLCIFVDLFVECYVDVKFDYVVGFDVCGFIIVLIVVYELSVGFVLICKVGKLLYKICLELYDFEYGSVMVEIYEDVCCFGDCVIIMDDLIVIGGMMMVGCNLL